jgi:riboflavin kinase / FMN adenylyltransferase
MPARHLEVQLVAVVAVTSAERGEHRGGDAGDDPHAAGQRRRVTVRAAAERTRAPTHRGRGRHAARRPRRCAHAAILAPLCDTPAPCDWHSVGVQRLNGLEAVPPGFGPSVVTIGNFDGVHRGHQAVLTEVAAAARRRGLRSVAVTFEPHPVAVLFPDRAPAVLTPLDVKLDLLAATGLDAVLVLPFTHEFARWTPERFVKEVFVDALRAKLIVVGRDTRFGHRNSGDVGTLRELGDELGFEVHVVQEVGVPQGEREEGEESGRGPRWSSSLVRELLARGDVAEAARILGRPHRVSGVVVHGDHRGRELGYPTANLAPDVAGDVPADGVYAGRLLRPELPPGSPDPDLPAAISIGTNPTFDGRQRRVEAYVLDRDDLELYGERIVLEFVDRLRPMMRFDGVGALVAQMSDDVARSRDVLGVPQPSATTGP